MTREQSLFQQLETIEASIGYIFQNKQILALAFIHCSYVNESKTVSQHNERLEFLGDSVLGLIVSEYLYQKLPDHPEGELSALRSRLVEADSCIKYIAKLNIAQFMLLGKGERLSFGRSKETIMADLFEALIGAIFLDGGFEKAKQFFFAHFAHEIEKILATPDHNWKAILQDYCQKNFHTTPNYDVLEESGPDHDKQFKIAVMLNEQTLGIGTGRSKKEAQQAAASQALKNQK